MNLVSRAIKPSPENDDVFGEIAHDEQVELLVASIKARGLEEPLILTKDRRVEPPVLQRNSNPCKFA